jgi:hypothetical protein
MRKKDFVWLVISLLLLTIPSCKDNPVNPEDNIPPGKRDYVWSIDSVDYGNLLSTIQLESIWGSSATDVWGANGDAPDVRDCLWHYDGIKWTRATEGTPITEFTGNKVVYSVWGSAQNDVWAFGRKINQGTLSAFIMHYDGNQWVDATPANVSALSAHLYCSYATAADNIWVGGYEYALHYNGSNWDTYKVADSITVGSISGNSRYLYLTTYSPWTDTVLTYIYKFNGSGFDIIDQSPRFPNKFGLGLWAQEQKLNSFTNGVISTSINTDGTIDVNGWQRELTTTTYFNGRGGYCIQSSKNVFAVGQWNLAYHYNGTNWAGIDINIPGHTVDPYAIFWGVWTDGNEVFISDTENGIIYHGR